MHPPAFPLERAGDLEADSPCACSDENAKSSDVEIH
jgi:hypothetical protein